MLTCPVKYKEGFKRRKVLQPLLASRCGGNNDKITYQKSAVVLMGEILTKINISPRMDVYI